jgi:hypothetical protein
LRRADHSFKECNEMCKQLNKSPIYEEAKAFKDCIATEQVIEEVARVYFHNSLIESVSSFI